MESQTYSNNSEKLLSKQENESRYKNFITTVPVAFYTCDADGYIEYYNKAAVELWGREPEIGRELWCGSWKIFKTNGDSLPLDDCPMAIALKKGEIKSFEIVIERPDGTKVSVIPHPEPLFDSDGKISGATNTLVDISEQVKAREDINKSKKELAESLDFIKNELGTQTNLLKESEIRSKNILHYAPDAVIKIDEKETIRNWNPKAEEMFGWKEEEVIDKPLSKILIPERYKAKNIRAFQHHLKTGEGLALNTPIEVLALKKDGSEILIELKISSFQVNDHKMFVGFARDITQIKDIKNALKKKTSQLEEAQKLAHIGNWEWDVLNDTIEWSEELYHIHGVKPQEFEGGLNNLLEFIHPDDKEMVEEINKQAFKDKSPFNLTYRIVLSTGQIKTLCVRGRSFSDNKGNVVRMIGTAQDITEQNEYKEKLEKSKEWFLKIFDKNPIPMALSEVKTNKIRFANSKFYSEFGYSAEEVIGNTSEELELMSVKEHTKITNKILEILQESRSLEEIQSLSVDETEDLLNKLKLSDAMKDFEILYTRKDGTTFPALISFEVINFGSEKFTIASYHNISERKKSQEQLAEQNTKLLKANKELEAFNYISSHDLQEPLRKIQIVTNRILSKEYDGLSESGKEYFDMLLKSASRMQTLIQDLLVYSKTSASNDKFEDTDLNAIIEEVKLEFKDIIEEKKATIDIKEMCRFKVIPYQFRQLITNLMGNALKFSTNDTTPHITINAETKKGNKLNNKNLCNKKLYCHLSFSDNGIGFEEEYKEKIFEVFQRLHTTEKYTGTGIGLSIVKKIVENHDGTITATGSLNKGATFDIYFPAN